MQATLEEFGRLHAEDRKADRKIICELEGRLASAADHEGLNKLQKEFDKCRRQVGELREENVRLKNRTGKSPSPAYGRTAAEILADVLTPRIILHF